jgi:hypothetical protein
MMGYIVNESGSIVCTREGERYEQSRTAIIQIDGPREIVDRLIAVADSPRSLVGRSRDGSAVLLFRHDSYYSGGGVSATNSIRGTDSTYASVGGGGSFLARDFGQGVLDLVLSGNGEPLRLAFGGDALDPSAWTWPKGRSPADVPRDSLPNLTGDVCGDIRREALQLGTDAKAAREEAERNKAFEARRAKYIADLAKPKSAEQLLFEEDEKILAQYAGETLAWNDADKPRLDAARARRAQRLKQTSAA